jgi:fructosamine-3-kinase
VDLAHLHAHPHLLTTLLTHQRIRETPVPGGDICAASRLTLDDGSSLFAKSPLPSAPLPPGLLPAEAAGLRWLRETGTVAVPQVITVSDEILAMEWIDAGPPSPAAAERFGRDLAALHRCGAPAFGAPWPGFIGRLPQDNTERAGPWPAWFAAHRLEPHLRTSVDRGALSGADAALVTRVISGIDGYGGDEPPARIHGDLWPGNLVWTPQRVWLIDPAAHGGHRETDLATLALFGGAPHRERILAAYQEVWPLADGWSARVPVHQLHLMLVHTALFGDGWRDAVMAVAAAAWGAGR